MQPRNFPTLAVAVLMALSSPMVGQARDFYVVPGLTSDARDSNPGDGVCNPCTLRAAVQEANAWPGADKIFLPAGHYRLTLAGRGEDLAATGDLDILDGQVEIVGASAETTIIDGNGIDRVFDIGGANLIDGLLKLDSVAIQGGEALASTFPEDAGGGILVRFGQTLQLHRSRMIGNRAGRGAAIAVDEYSRAIISDSLISNNSIEPHTFGISGGAIHAFGVEDTGLRIDRSTISDNRSPSGFAYTGGINLFRCVHDTGSPIKILNTTISGNHGNGLSIGECDAHISHATIVGNQVGLRLNKTSHGLLGLQVDHSILANKVQDCWLIAGDFYLAGNHNLSSDTTCDLDPSSGDIEGVDPLLLPLGTYGESVPAHPPSFYSPAVDTGGSGPSLSEDQHGYPRPLDGNKDGIARLDIGSIEALPCPGKVDFVLFNVTIYSGAKFACGWIITGPGVHISGGPVYFFAREGVSLGNGFSIATNSIFSVTIERAAGMPL